MEFPITVESQEEFDGLVKDRLARITNKHADELAKFADYDDLKTRAETLEAEKAEIEQERDAAVTRAETAEGVVAKFESEQQVSQWRAEVATASGIPADILRGSTKEEFEAHAELLKPLLTAQQAPVIPNQGDSPDPNNKPASPWSEVLQGIDQSREA
jgi:alpha-galactosidase/6-phospho-beta-glucosidase family protein